MGQPSLPACGCLPPPQVPSLLSTGGATDLAIFGVRGDDLSADHPGCGEREMEKRDSSWTGMAIPLRKVNRFERLH
jgi:hypothetical protein